MRTINCVVCFALLLAATGRGEELGHLTDLAAEEAKRLAGDKTGTLLLNGLATLSPASATELARHEGWLSLNGLSSISGECAETFSQHKGALHLDGLKTLSDEAARALAKHRGELSLNGLTSISDETAEALARHRDGRLLLKGLTSLSPKAARALAQRKGGGPTHQLQLDGLTTLSPEVAAALAPMHPHNWNGRLPALESISDEVARALAKREHGLSLEGLTSLSHEAAEALQSKRIGRLPKLTALSPQLARALAMGGRTHNHSPLILDGLETLSDEAATELTAGTRCDLSLNGLTTLSPVAARAISQRERDLFLNGLTTISNEALEALAEHKSPGYARPVVYLKGLTSLSDEGAAVLASWPKWCGELPALTTLSEQGAAALASSQKWDGKPPSLQSLPVEVARALAKRNGDLSLDGLTSLTGEAAAALAEHRGGTLSLDGLQGLTDRAATELAPHKGRLSCGGLKTLTNGVAQALAGYRGDWLFLDGLTSLSPEAATILAGREGVLSVKGLKTLSDEALRTLREKSSLVVLPDSLQRRTIAAAPVPAAANAVHEFFDFHCADCHGDGSDKGDFKLEILKPDDIVGRVAYASILERLRAGDMPPAKKPRPDGVASEAVMKWIVAKLDSQLAGPVAPYPVKDMPIDGNRLPHAILFGGTRGPSVPPPPRLWRLSPQAYARWVGEFDTHGLQQPFGVIPDPGFKDYAALYTPDEGASGLLLSNAEQIVSAQTRSHLLVNVVEDPEAAKHRAWPDGARAGKATPEERKHLEKGVRVSNGHGVFAPLLHPVVRANRDELERALQHQFKTSLARPPRDAEIEGLVALYNKVAGDGDMRLAGETVLTAPLLMPEAILRFEVGLGREVRPGVRMLSPREVAFALSYALSTQRDRGVFAAAEKGELTTREEVADHVQRILDTRRAGKSRVLRFFREYFDYHRAPEIFKDPLPDHLHRRGVHYDARRLVGDTDLLVVSILGRDKDVLKELLTTSESFRSHELFHVNGALNDRSNGESPIFRNLPPIADQNRRPHSGERIGILMQPSWHVAWSTNFHNDIVRRGRWVRERLLGGRVPDLPVDAAAMVPDDPHRTLRQRQLVTREAKCWKCHQRMDDLGLPFEDLDHYGFLRRAEEVLDRIAMEQSKDKNRKIYRGAPLDTTGLIAFSGDPQLDGPVRDAPEMMRRLAESDRVRQVIIRHVFRYFLGRNETPGDAVTLQEADRAYRESGGSFKALLVSLLSSESFLYRSVPTLTKASR